MLVGHYVNGEIQTESRGVVSLTPRELDALRTISVLGTYRLGDVEVRVVPETIVERESPAR
jgi:hypothetical protein